MFVSQRSLNGHLTTDNIIPGHRTLSSGLVTAIRPCTADMSFFSAIREREYTSSRMPSNTTSSRLFYNETLQHALFQSSHYYFHSFIKYTYSLFLLINSSVNLSLSSSSTSIEDPNSQTVIFTSSSLPSPSVTLSLQLISGKLSSVLSMFMNRSFL